MRDLLKEDNFRHHNSWNTRRYGFQNYKGGYGYTNGNGFRFNKQDLKDTILIALNDECTRRRGKPHPYISLISFHCRFEDCVTIRALGMVLEEMAKENLVVITHDMKSVWGNTYAGYTIAPEQRFIMEL